MSDERIRRLERAAATGDEEAERALHAERIRSGYLPLRLWFVGKAPGPRAWLIHICVPGGAGPRALCKQWLGTESLRQGLWREVTCQRCVMVLGADWERHYKAHLQACSLWSVPSVLWEAPGERGRSA